MQEDPSTLQHPHESNDRKGKRQGEPWKLVGYPDLSGEVRPMGNPVSNKGLLRR